MKTVVFTMYVDRETHTDEIEIEGQIERGFGCLRLASVDHANVNGVDLDESEIEDLLMEIGFDLVEEHAVHALPAMPQVA